MDDFLDEFIESAAENGQPVCSKLKLMTADEIWLRSPQEQCDEEFAIYKEISRPVFQKLDDIDEALIIAEGAAFTPEIMKKVKGCRYICMVPTPEFQISHYQMREWVPHVLKECTEKRLAFDNWMQRDILFANKVKTLCEADRIPCIVNDGMKSIDEVYETVKCYLDLS